MTPLKVFNVFGVFVIVAIGLIISALIVSRRCYRTLSTWLMISAVGVFVLGCAYLIYDYVVRR